jgi:tetratricopeptide (TPR) repeat protein
LTSDAATLDIIQPQLETYLQTLISQPDVWPITDVQRFFNPRTLNFDEIITASRPRTSYDPKDQAPNQTPGLKVDTTLSPMHPSTPNTPMTESKSNPVTPLEAKSLVSPLYDRLNSKQAAAAPMVPRKFEMPLSPPNAILPVTRPSISSMPQAMAPPPPAGMLPLPTHQPADALPGPGTATRRLSMNAGKVKAAASEAKLELYAELDRVDITTQDFIEAGCQRQLKHPALRAFWRVRLDSSSKVTHTEFLEAMEAYLQSIVTPPMTKTALTTIKDGLKSILERIDTNGDGMITIFEVNQWTKHLDPNLTLLATLGQFNQLRTLKLIPTIKSDAKQQIVWGTNMYRKPIRDTVLSSMHGADSWTVVYGPSLSGKSYRWLVGAHELPSEQTVVWIDLNSVSTVQEMYSSVSAQLSLSVLSLDDMISEFRLLLERYISSACTIVIDHVDITNQVVYYPLIKTIRKLKKNFKMAVVLISSLESRPSLEDFAKEIKVPISGITVIYIGPLPREESLTLAQYYKVADPTLLMEAARHLPGYIRSMRFLPLSSLVAITRSADASMTSSRSVDGSIAHTRDIIIAENLSELEIRCAMCLYHPLIGNNGLGFIFSKAIAWNLCYEAVSRNVDTLNTTLARLVEVGWLRLVADEGYLIAPTSCLPSYPATSTALPVNELHQWSIYYRYWIGEAVRMNEQLRSKDQLVACSYYDSSRKHFETFFEHLCQSPIWQNAFPPPVVHELICHLSSGIAHIIEYRFQPAEGLRISKAILRILCRGDDSGRIVDERYWRNDAKLKSVILRAVVNLAWDYYRTGQQVIAEEIIQAVLKFYARDDEVNFAYALNKLAIILRGLGRNEDALEMHKKCYALRMSVFGEEHIDSAQSMNNIAIVLNALGRKDEAIKAHERCLAIRVALLGKKHVAVGDSNFNLAGVYQSIGKNEDALECYKRARAAYIATYGKKHVYVKELDAKMKQVFNLVVQTRDAAAKEAANTSSLSLQDDDLNASTMSLPGINKSMSNVSMTSANGTKKSMPSSSSNGDVKL